MPARSHGPAGTTHVVVRFEAIAGNAPAEFPAMVPGSAGAITIESAIFWVNKVVLLYDRQDDDKIKMKDLIIDLSGTEQAAFTFDDAPPALYSGVNVKFDRPDKVESVPGPDGGNGGGQDAQSANDGSAPAAPPRVAFSVSGTVAGGGHFVIRDKDDLEIELKVADGTDVAVGQRLIASLSFDVGAWFDQVVVPASAPDTTVIIDSGDTLSRFRDNLARSVMLAFRVERR